MKWEMPFVRKSRMDMASGSAGILLLRYMLTRLHRMDTGGIAGLDIEGLAKFMDLELGDPKGLQDEMRGKFGVWADTADRLLTGEPYVDDRGQIHGGAR